MCFPLIFSSVKATGERVEGAGGWSKVLEFGVEGWRAGFSSGTRGRGPFGLQVMRPRANCSLSAKLILPREVNHTTLPSRRLYANP